MAKAAKQDLADIPIGLIRWGPVGHVGRDQDGDLVFPPVAAVPGIYRFMIYDGAGVAAGYIGQAAKVSTNPSPATAARSPSGGTCPSTGPSLFRPTSVCCSAGCTS